MIGLFVPSSQVCSVIDDLGEELILEQIDPVSHQLFIAARRDYLPLFRSSITSAIQLVASYGVGLFQFVTSTVSEIFSSRRREATDTRAVCPKVGIFSSELIPLRG